MLKHVSYGFTACRGSSPYCHEENYPNPKSGRDIDPDKPACAMSCQGDVTDPLSAIMGLVRQCEKSMTGIQELSILQGFRPKLVDA